MHFPHILAGCNLCDQVLLSNIISKPTGSNIFLKVECNLLKGLAHTTRRSGVHYSDAEQREKRGGAEWTHHRRVISEGVQVPHVAVDQPADVLHLGAQVLVGGVRAQHPDPESKPERGVTLMLPHLFWGFYKADSRGQCAPPHLFTFFLASTGCTCGMTQYGSSNHENVNSSLKWINTIIVTASASHKTANKGKQVQGGPLRSFSALLRRWEMDSHAEISFFSHAIQKISPGGQICRCTYIKHPPSV